MTTISDTLTVGLVLVLLFGSIALYLYTCIQQSEQKISLLESILLDLKMSNELKGYTELPADHVVEVAELSHESLPSTPKNPKNEDSSASITESSALAASDYTPFIEEEETTDTGVELLAEDLSADSISSPTEAASKVNYDSMTLKELQGLAKSKGITGLTKKAALIEALQSADQSVKPGSVHAVGSNSFLETSAIVSDEVA
jgi:hypothetical protein